MYIYFDKVVYEQKIFFKEICSCNCFHIDISIVFKDISFIYLCKEADQPKLTKVLKLKF